MAGFSSASLKCDLTIPTTPDKQHNMNTNLTAALAMAAAMGGPSVNAEMPMFPIRSGVPWSPAMFDFLLSRPRGFNFAPERNQRKTRKNRRRAWAAGDKKAFR